MPGDKTAFRGVTLSMHMWIQPQSVEINSGFLSLIYAISAQKWW
jgi:hypothetical protein